MFGTLYIVATPIGNLKDITLRALEILKEVDLVLAEDTRVTKKLFDFIFSYQSPITNHQSPTKPMVLSYHQHSSESKKLQILQNLIEGRNIALVTDAGTPGISDPGNELIDYLLRKEPGIKVVPIPGASAITAALSVSGMRCDKFIFLGFLPKKKGKLAKLIDRIDTLKMTFAFYESPHRIVKTLEYLSEILGEDRRILVARELTKMHESLYGGNVDEVLKKIKKDVVKGEIVVVVEGK